MTKPLWFPICLNSSVEDSLTDCCLSSAVHVHVHRRWCCDICQRSWAPFVPRYLVQTKRGKVPGSGGSKLPNPQILTADIDSFEGAPWLCLYASGIQHRPATPKVIKRSRKEITGQIQDFMRVCHVHWMDCKAAA